MSSQYINSHINVKVYPPEILHVNETKYILYETSIAERCLEILDILFVSHTWSYSDTLHSLTMGHNYIPFRIVLLLTWHLAVAIATKHYTYLMIWSVGHKNMLIIPKSIKVVKNNIYAKKNVFRNIEG